MFAGKNAFIKLQPFVLCSRPNLRRVSRSLYTMSLKKESMILCHFAKKEQPVHLLQTGIPMSQLFYFHTAHAVPPLDAARTFFPMRQTGRPAATGISQPPAAGLPAPKLFYQIDKIAVLSITGRGWGHVPLAAKLPDALEGGIDPADLLIIGRSGWCGGGNLVLIIQLAYGLVSGLDLLLLCSDGNGELGGICRRFVAEAAVWAALAARFQNSSKWLMAVSPSGSGFSLYYNTIPARPVT